MPSSLRIGAPLNADPHPVLQWIEVASFLQIPSLQVIGLPAPEVAEAKERVRAAIESSGLEFPRRRLVVNLSPASVRKRGTGGDLAMALAILHEAFGVARQSKWRSVVGWGELGLDGRLKPVGRATRAVFAAWESGADLLIVCREELGAAIEALGRIQESRLLPGIPPRIAGVHSLEQAWEILRSGDCPPPSFLERALSQAALLPSPRSSAQSPDTSLLPLAPSLQRVLGAAAAGAHHLLLLGPRGTGKSHALDWLVALQPPLPPGLGIRNALLAELVAAPGQSGAASSFPVRRISSQVRPAALLGSCQDGGMRPGEFSLAHGGLLIADEFPEWPRDAREALREPLERGTVSLTRAQQSLEVEARFTLAANGNLCPCGGWPPGLPPPPGEADAPPTRCRCSEGMRTRYLSRLSGPILDRLDLVALLTGPGAASLKKDNAPEALRARVTEARERALARWGGLPGHLAGSDLERLLADHPGWRKSLEGSRFSSLRARHKALRVALTLAAWDGEPAPGPAHFAEAACYRPERLGLTG